MDRLTTGKPVKDRNMIELALNCVCVDHKRNVIYRDYEQEVDARQLTIKLLDKLSDTPNEFTCDEDFDMYMAELLAEPIDTIDGLIAVFHRNLLAMAELRERLMAFEDRSAET